MNNEYRQQNKSGGVAGAETEMTDPFELGQAIDTVVKVLQKHLDDDMTAQWPVA